ncbi:uncharacterized protein LOC108867747 [Pyrus x bretschneideri]|uniref:uncharacterized protein LOC108867747 n=1 Tax=Pyrus x bretschneideri TaxID=225117 RepID=UPI00202E1DD1|nr:uncharacterized protein LOC108867747 [Pyrus x bretschneideri]
MILSLWAVLHWGWSGLGRSVDVEPESEIALVKSEQGMSILGYLWWLKVVWLPTNSNAMVLGIIGFIIYLEVPASWPPYLDIPRFEDLSITDSDYELKKCVVSDLEATFTTWSEEYESLIW